MNAMVFTNSLIYTSPNIDQKNRGKVQSTWNKFIDSITWDKEKKDNKVKSAKSILTAFGKAGIPMTKKKVTK